MEHAELTKYVDFNGRERVFLTDYITTFFTPYLQNLFFV